jgi:hypothetical protein
MFKTIAGIVGGGVVGTVAGVVLTPVNMLYDATAPVSYPLGCAASGAVSPVLGTPKEKVGGAMLGALIGAAHVPLAPLFFATRPVTSPVMTGLFGAVAGGVMAHRFLEK